MAPKRQSKPEYALYAGQVKPWGGKHTQQIGTFRSKAKADDVARSLRRHGMVAKVYKRKTPRRLKRNW
jgi:cell division septation protein DedD